MCRNPRKIEQPGLGMGRGRGGHHFASLLPVVESVQIVSHCQLQPHSLHALVQTARAKYDCPALLVRKVTQVEGGWPALGDQGGPQAGGQVFL